MGNATRLPELHQNARRASARTVRNSVYKQSQNIDAYIYPALTLAQP